MSATKNWVHDYTDRLDAFLEAMEDAVSKGSELNDVIYTEGGDIRSHCPQTDVAMVSSLLQSLREQVDTVANAREPQRHLNLAAHP